jgi:hypothetical protein
MSERDDEYLWSGRGPAPDEVTQLEKLLGGEKLRAPLRSRPRRRILLSIAVAALAAAAAFAFSREGRPPPGWLAAMMPGVSSEDLEGALYEFALTDDAPPAGWQKAIEARLSEFAPRAVRFEGRKVVVDFARAFPVELDEVLSRRGDFAIQEVIEASPLMQALYTRVDEGDPLARKLGVAAEVDAWEHDASGRRFADWYLSAPSREALETYVRAVGAENPRLAPDSAHEIAFEPMRPEQSAVPRWRSYYLDRVAWLSNADIVNAYVYWNPDTSRPEVLVEFDSAGARRFEDLTARIAGHKLAILLDGQISSAPVVQDRIGGGRTSITMGGRNPEQVQREAQELVNVLRASQHPLPVALRLIKRTIRSDRFSEDELQAARITIALGFGLLVFALLFIGERRMPGIDPEVSPVRGRPRQRSLPWVRLLVSGAGVAAVILAERIPVTSAVDWAGLQPISLFALGITPAISAFLLVELAALIVPRWRPLRRGGPSARARLGSATVSVALVLALVQSWMIADYMLSMPPLAHLSRWLLIVSFTGGALVVTFVALLISRYGLGNGFAVLLLAGHGALAYRAVHFLSGGTADPKPILAFLTAIVLAAIATTWIVRSRVRGASPASSVRLPTAGVVPLAMVPGLMVLFALSWPEAAARIGIWWQEAVGRPGAGILVELGFVVATGAALSWLFSRPARLGNATAGVGRLRGFLIASAISIAYLVLLALLGRWQAVVLGYFGIALSSVAIATAIIMDLVAEWRAFARRDDLVPIWPLHQVQRVDLVTDALARNQMDVHARGLHLRLLLHFFGPFVPVLLYVPAEQAEEARAIIRAQLEAR